MNIWKTFLRSSALILVAVTISAVPSARAATESVITVGFSPDLQTVLSGWDLATNVNAIFDVSVSAGLDRGFVIVPYNNTDIYVGGIAGTSNQTSGFIAKYGVGGELKWLNGGTYGTGQVQIENRALAVDANGDAYVGTTISAGGKTANRFAKYLSSTGLADSSAYPNSWPRIELDPCTSQSAQLTNLIIDGTTLYGAGSGRRCSDTSYVWRVMGTTTLSQITGKDDIQYQLVAGRDSTAITNTPNTSSKNIAIATVGGKRYVYFFGRANNATYSNNRLLIARFDVTSGNLVAPVQGDTVNTWYYLTQPFTALYNASIAVDSGGAAYITSSVSRQDGTYPSYQYYTMKYNSAGTLVWSVLEPIDGRTEDGQLQTVANNARQNNAAADIAVAADGGSIYITGRSYPTSGWSGWGSRFYTVQRDAASGARINTSVSNFGLGEQALGMAVTTNGVYITGYVPYDMGPSPLVAVKPNLSALDLYTSATSGTADAVQPITISGSFRNTANILAGPTTIHFCVDDEVNCANLSGISVYATSTNNKAVPENTTITTASSTSSYTWTPTLTPRATPYRLTMCVDIYDVVPESDETDNCRTEDFTVPVPVVAHLDANGESITFIDRGESATLNWSASDNATVCTGAGFSTGGATSGSTSTGSLNTDTDYQVTCTGAGGQDTKPAFVKMSRPKAYITASPTRVRPLGTTNVSWSATDVKSCYIDRTGFDSPWRSSSSPDLTPDGNFNVGTTSINMSPTFSIANLITEQTTYTLICNDGNAESSAQVTVNIPPVFQSY